MQIWEEKHWSWRKRGARAVPPRAEWATQCRVDVDLDFGSRSFPNSSSRRFEEESAIAPNRTESRRGAPAGTVGVVCELRVGRPVSRSRRAHPRHRRPPAPWLAGARSSQPCRRLPVHASGFGSTPDSRFDPNPKCCSKPAFTSRELAKLPPFPLYPSVGSPLAESIVAFMRKPAAGTARGCQPVPPQSQNRDCHRGSHMGVSCCNGAF